jgi:hypothetical protein
MTSGLSSLSSTESTTNLSFSGFTNKFCWDHSHESTFKRYRNSRLEVLSVRLDTNFSTHLTSSDCDFSTIITEIGKSTETELSMGKTFSNRLFIRSSKTTFSSSRVTNGDSNLTPLSCSGNWSWNVSNGKSISVTSNKVDWDFLFIFIFSRLKNNFD